MLKKFLIGTFAVLALGFALSASAAYDFGTTTLRVGSKGEYVKTLQTLVGATPVDGVFGNGTKAKVMAWQANNGLTADGVFGPMSMAKANAGSTTGGTYPAGCTSTSGFSSTTGAKCDGTTTGGTDNGPLTGGAGSVTVTSTSTDVESSVKESEENVKVLGFKVEAEDSDVAITNLKINLFNDEYATTSEKLTDYVDEVTVWMGSTKVATVDASDFSRDSGSPDEFSKTVALTNAVVRDGKKVSFYVAVTAASSIDSSDLGSATGADWNVEVLSLRYQDATGVIMSEDLTETEIFYFADSSTDDKADIKSSTANPVASTLQVEADTTSDSMLVGAFKLDVDEDSSDLKVNEIPLVLTFDDSSNTASSDDDTALVDEVTVKIDGEEYTAELDTEAITNGDGTATYLVTLDEGDVTINAGDDAEVKIYVKFNDQDGNYGTGTTVYATVVGANIDAEGANDDVTVGGTFTGKTHTLTVDAPTFSLVSKKFELSQAIDGVAAGQEDVFLAQFVFNVTAGDEDVYLPKMTYNTETVLVDASGDTVIAPYDQLGAGAVDSVVFDAEDDSLDDNTTSSFLVSAGDTEKFTLSFYVRANNTSEKFTINSFAYDFQDDTTVGDDYLYAESVSAGLSSFATNSVYLAK